MDEGWTRWLLETYHFQVDTLHNADVNKANLQQYHAVILPSQRPNSMLNGYAAQTMPAAYTGGLGLDGTLALNEYVENGGTLIALDAASDFVIEQFGLPVKKRGKKTCHKMYFLFRVRLFELT